jgi:hypothetical protein
MEIMGFYLSASSLKPLDGFRLNFVRGSPLLLLLCNSPKAKARSQIMMMAVFARPVVDLNLSGKQMAYQRSTEMNVRVSTDTATDTVCRTHNRTFSISVSALHNVDCTGYQPVNLVGKQE